jgi:hypothetical protein
VAVDQGGHGGAVALAHTSAMFRSLDFVYLPSREVASELKHLVDGLGGSLVFAIERFGTRVAMVEMAPGSPAVLLAEHLDGNAPVLVYRVEDLEETVATLAGRGVDVRARFGIPHGPGAELAMAGPQRIAVYQLTRPEAPGQLAGRRDF